MSKEQLSVAVIGAGKIGRGFLGHICYRAGYAPTFVDSNAELVALLSARGRYAIMRCYGTCFAATADAGCFWCVG